MPTLQHVRELSLRGTDALIVAADSAFLGLPFREVSRSIVTGENEARLLEAWNSRRFFAWSERTFFRTPYSHADIRVTSTAFEVRGVLRAEMRGEREPSWVGEEEQTYKVHLPRGGYFYARLAGRTPRTASRARTGRAEARPTVVPP